MIYRKKQPLLYVDDTVEQRYAMRRVLEQEGYSVMEAGTGGEALRAIEHSPSLVILDVKLPDMSGYEVCRRIKKLEPGLPVLQVSASFSDPNLRVSGLSGGADAYIAQPVHPAELAALVRTLLASSVAESDLRFLARIGPKLSYTLHFPETAVNVAQAIVPYFADRCILYLPKVPGETEAFWPGGSIVDDSLNLSMMKAAAEGKMIVEPRMIVGQLPASVPGFGSIAFVLDGSGDSDREYSAEDADLASDIADRAGLALQNCMLFTAEQATRSALIEAEKLATAGRMSAAIAHEINNPLEALTNLIYIIEQSNEATDLIREKARTALSELSRLAHITRQSLGFYREPSSPLILNLNETANETLTLYSARLQTKRVRIVSDFGKPVTIRAIKGEIRQVISNLLLNAFEAMEEGGMLSLGTRRKGSKAVLSIGDTGPGIQPEMSAKIFEAFYTTKGDTGTGLGLWITKNIVEKNHGTITVFSRNGKDDHGTTFEIEFPFAEA